MSDPLSVLDAARDAGDAPALRIDGSALSFSDVAAMARERMAALERDRSSRVPYALVASNALDTVISLYALLELRVPALLVHPRLTAPERDALLVAAARAIEGMREDDAVIIHTSGTTGEPRGAVLTRGALVASAAASSANLGWVDDECWLMCMPIARIGGLSILTRCLASRRTVAVTDGFDPVLFPDLVDRHRVTLASLVPTMLSQVLETHAGWTPPLRLRAVLIGGAAASRALLARATARRLPIVLTYGLTETCSQVVATCYADRHSTVDRGVGVPLPGAEVRIVGDRIEVRGPMLMRGYWNERPRQPEDWLDTGDFGEWDSQGNLHLLSRRVDLIVSGGENVYPAEVERALERCPGIAAAAVFGVPDDRWGQVVAAALVADHGGPRGDDLAAWIARNLAPHKRPRRICYVPHLPQAASGKLDRSALPDLASSLQPLATPADRAGQSRDATASGLRPESGP